MPSPFPGMDPYLEAHWGDIHQRMVTYAADQLQSRLPSGLKARMEERVFVQSSQSGQHPIYPDVRVVENSPRGKQSRAVGGVAVLERVNVQEPLIILLPDEEVVEGYIQIIDAGSGNRVVTVIEVLSPANKHPGDGQRKYVQKQEELREGRVSLVEIDLLRTGTRRATVRREQVPPSHRTPYQVCVRRGWRPEAIEIYRVPLQEPLPIIKVPLRESDEDVLLELQPLIEQAYRNGAYEDTDYSMPPAPPLEGEDAAWAEALLREKGLRT